jgi:hypothetical protein
VLALAGCGSNALSGGELQTRATAICAAATRQADAIAAPASPAGGPAFLQAGIAVFTTELSELRTLTPPTGVASVYATALSAFSGKLDALRGTAHQLRSRSDPVTGIKALEQRLAPLERQEDEAWRALGIAACVNL